MRRFSNILLVVDERTDHSAALSRGIALANNNQASITVCAVVDTVPGEVQMGVIAVTPQEVLDIAVAGKRAWLDDAVTSAAADGVSIDTKVLVGKPFLEIIREVLRDDHDLVIKCSDPDRSLREVFFSSTDKHLMRKCPCPVWIIKPTERPKYLRVLAAVDQDPNEPIKDELNRQILELSSSMALAEYGEAHVVHAWELFGEDIIRSRSWDFTETEFDAMLEEESAARRQWLEKLVKENARSADHGAAEVPEIHLHVVKGHPERVVSELARALSVDLVVMGTVARTGIDGFFMGNTAESILAQIDCSVLTVKPPGFVSPVTLGE